MSELGAGVAIDFFQDHVLLSPMVDLTLNATPELHGTDNSWFRIGVGPSGTARVQTHGFVLLTSATWWWLPASTIHSTWSIDATLRKSYAHNFAIGVGGVVSPESRELQLQSLIYF